MYDVVIYMELLFYNMSLIFFQEKIVHAMQKIYPCEICHKQFSQLRNKKRHQGSKGCPGKLKNLIEEDSKKASYVKFTVIQPHPF